MKLNIYNLKYTFLSYMWIAYFDSKFLLSVFSH